MGLLDKITGKNNSDYDVDILQCPACLASSFNYTKETITCSACKHVYEIVDGIPMLLQDPSMFTQLEGIDYDAHHSLSAELNEKQHSVWGNLFNEFNIEYGDVLEIGSGTGQLTHALAEKMPFQRVQASDISNKFLGMIRENAAAETKDKLRYYGCDANYLPFKDNTFNLVLGNSVLHHFVDYQNCIKKVHAILKPGGRAIFHEPVIQGKIWVAFFADLMLRIEKNTNFGVLDESDEKKLKHHIRHIMKESWIGDDRKKLGALEDKYIFSITKMKKLADELGFSKMDFVSNEFPENGMWRLFNHHLLLMGIDAEKVNKFFFLTYAFQQTFFTMMPDEMVTPMGYFVFTK